MEVIRKAIGKEMRAVTAATPSIAAGGLATVTITWPSPMPSADYEVAALIEGGSGDLVVTGISNASKLAESVGIMVWNRNTLNARTGTLRAKAIQN